MAWNMVRAQQKGARVRIWLLSSQAPYCICPHMESCSKALPNAYLCHSAQLESA